MRKPITAESLAKSRPHVHRASSPLTVTLLDVNQRAYLVERCACGCSRVVLFNGCRRLPGNWT